jgi:hypothetical protein
MQSKRNQEFHQVDFRNLLRFEDTFRLSQSRCVGGYVWIKIESKSPAVFSHIMAEPCRARHQHASLPWGPVLPAVM